MDIRKELDKIAEQLDRVQHQLSKEKEQERLNNMEREFDKILGKMAGNEPINIEGLKVRLTDLSRETFGNNGISLEGHIIGLAD